MSIRAYNESVSGMVTGKFSFLKLLLSFISSGHTVFEGIFFDGRWTFENHVLEKLQEAYPDSGYLGLELEQNARVELLTYGFVEAKDNLTEGIYHSYDYAFTPRWFRFRFWLEVNELSGETPLFEIATEANQITNAK